MLTDANIEGLKGAAGALAPLGMAEKPQAIAAKPKREAVKYAEGSVPLANARHERFCLLVAYGADGRHLTAAEAYRRAFMRGKRISEASARVNASRLRSKHPEVEARIKWLDGEIRREVLLNRGGTFAETLNDVKAVKDKMMRQAGNPKAATVALAAAQIILKATGTDAPETETRTETAEVRQGADALGEIRAILTKVQTVAV